MRLSNKFFNRVTLHLMYLVRTPFQRIYERFAWQETTENSFERDIQRLFDQNKVRICDGEAVHVAGLFERAWRNSCHDTSSFSCVGFFIVWRWRIMNNHVTRSFSSDFLTELISFPALCDVRMRWLIEDIQRFVNAFLYVCIKPGFITISSMLNYWYIMSDLLVLWFLA